MTRLVTREMYEEQVREMEKRLEAEGKYIDRIDEDGEIYREYIQPKENIRDRLMKKKRNLFEEKYSSIFDKIGEFENSIETTFEKWMKEDLFRSTFITENEIFIPFESEDEKKFIMQYIAKISPAGVEHARENGMTLTISTFILNEKKQIKMRMTYSMDLSLSLDEMLAM